MLQRLLELKSQIRCDSVHGALTEILQHLLVMGDPVTELVSLSSDGHDAAASEVFDQVYQILLDSHFLDASTPVSRGGGGQRRVRIPNPHLLTLHTPVRARITAQTSPAAVLLHAFLVLRVRYQISRGPNPQFRIEANVSDEGALDTLYLAGDCFTERYPVIAEWASTATTITLTLIGEPARITGGLTWARDDYVRCRDASLLVRPLRDALDGADRPLIVPRETHGAIGLVRARVPARLQGRPISIRWLESLQDLKHPAGSEVSLAEVGPLGEHVSVDPKGGGYVAAGSGVGTDAILSVRCIQPVDAVEAIVPESADGTIAIAFEAIGGAREIGANSYYYTFGHRGLLVDAGFDATRDGWLGLPAFERIARLDAMILTHAHLDHIGALATLLAVFPTVPVYCTRATLAVLLPQLEDSAKVGGIRFAQTGEAPAVSVGLARSLRREQFRLLDYRAREEVPEIPGLSLEFYDAGHIIGSSCTQLEFGGISILHTGDISVEDQHLLHGMPVDELKADHVIMEGTYCGEPTFTRQDRREAVSGFLTALAERIDAGGSVLVPAFSLGRAQELVGLLVDWNEQSGRSVPIWTVGMVNVLNDVSAAHPSFLPGMSGNPFAHVKPFPPVPSTASEEARREEFGRTFFRVAEQAPSVVIASHGMLAEGTGSYSIGRAILAGDDPRHAIFLCGYMDPRTPGFRLRYQSHEEVIDFGVGDPVRRRIPTERIQFHRLTAHASYEELVEVALNTGRLSVTFIHGDGKGLDELIADLQGRLQATNRTLKLRAPAIGERVLLGRTTPPDNWHSESSNATDEPLSIGPGRRFDQSVQGLSVRGLTSDRRWVLIAIGQSTAIVALEHDQIADKRIERVELRRKRGSTETLYDGQQGIEALGRIALGVPGEFELTVRAREPDDRLVEARFKLFCGAELRPSRHTLNSAKPMIELEVGGILDPRLLGVKVGGYDGVPLDIERCDWDSVSRILRIQLRPFATLRSFVDLYPHLQWPGFVQRGPSIGTFSLQPSVQLESSVAQVGIECQLHIQSSPRPLLVRMGSEETPFNEKVNFQPKHPGSVPIALCFDTVGGQPEWHEIAALTVRPAAAVELPTSTWVSGNLQVVVRDIAPVFRGAEVVLSIGEQVCERWVAGAIPHSWSGIVADSGSPEAEVRLSASNLTLWSGTIRIYEATEFDSKRSLTVTTADAALEAELVFVAREGGSRASIEAAFVAAGFVSRGWSGDALHVVGSAETIGSRTVIVPDASREIRVRVVTLPDLKLSLSPSRALSAGDRVSLCTSLGEISAGLQEIDGGPLSIQVERVEPLFDSLSSEISGGRILFLHAGRYTVSLLASRRALTSFAVDVFTHRDELTNRAVTRVTDTARSAYEASVFAATLSPARTIAGLSQPGQGYRIVQDDPVRLRPELWNFLSSHLRAGERILVSWPTLSLPHEGGELLRRVRADLPKVSVAHLGYPAPQGEIASDVSSARSLIAHGVLCTALSDATIDRQDNYACPACSKTPQLRTDKDRIWLHCPECGYVDRELILTLSGLRKSNADILFADYRMARYLSRGSGRRFAGAFGRSVRCTNCHGLQVAYARPNAWDHGELRLLVQALEADWDDSDPLTSIRKAARAVARRMHRSQHGDVSRFEDLVRRLLDSGVFKGGRASRTDLERLEAGASLCCQKPLMWSPLRVAAIFLEIEQLLSSAVPTAAHPDLPFGQAGVRAFLSLAESHALGSSARTRQEPN